MPFFPEKFFADTADVSPDAAAYYMVLLAHAWARGGSLPNDGDTLRLMTRLSGRRWQAIRDQILRYWTVGEDGRLHQKRMDKEWERAVERTANASATRQRKRHRETQQVREHEGKKPNDFSRAPARVYPQPQLRKEERAHMRAAPPGKNTGRKGRQNGADRNVSGIDLVRADIKRLEAEERELLRIEGGTIDEANLGPISPVRH